MFTFHFPAVRFAPDAGRRCGPAAPHLTPVAGALLLFCWGWPDTGQAAPNDVAALRTELEALKADYSARVQALEARDRKSTRLNSSHSQISYAVFCLKKKKKK